MAAARLLKSLLPARLLSLRFSSAETATAAGDLPPRRAMKHVFDEITAERDLGKLVEKFKSFSDAYRFRCNPHVYRVAVRRLASAGQFSAIEDILSAQKKYNCINKEGFCMRLLILYGKAGMFSHARELFDQMPQLGCARTVRSFNALLSAAVESKNLDKVPDMFKQLPEEVSMKPNLASYNLLINVYCKMGLLDDALSALEKMKEEDVVPDVVSFNMILSELYDKQRFADADNVWAMMEVCNVEPDVTSFNFKMRGLVVEGKTKEAMEIFNELGSKELKPDIHSYNAIIKGRCDEKNVEEAKRLYNELVKIRSMAPNYLTFVKMVPLLSEAGEFDMAFKLCKHSINQKRYIAESILQGVVDGLVKQSKMEEAKELVNVCKGHYDNDLVLPSE